MITNLNSDNISWEEFASSLPHSASDTERLMAAVTYRFEHEGTETTDISVVANEYFRRARWPRPSKSSATANHCAGKGWLSESGKSEGHKLWRVTRKGYKSLKTRMTV